MAKEGLKEKVMKKAIGMRFKQFREFIEKSQAELARLNWRRNCILKSI